jgi:alkylated DNA repair dioxygenase AlkB
MDLFNQTALLTNILPYDGTANYYGQIFSIQEANALFTKLEQNIHWKNDEVIIFGKHFITKREAAWYGDDSYSYTYSNSTKIALPWTNELRYLKQKIETLTGESFNSCLLNFYHNGTECMGWHSDDETMMKKNASIASLSFGATRKFSFKHKLTKQSTSLMLENGSLLVMKDCTQTHWLHSLPKTLKVTQPRINLTFRTVQL